MRTLGILFGSLVVLATVARADDAIPPGTVREIKAATVFVKVKVEGGSCSGSGFVVKADGADAFVVTNHHVIEPKLVEVLLAPSRRPSAPYAGPRHSIGPRPHRAPPSSSLLAPGYTPRVIVRSFKNAKVTVVFNSGAENEEAVSAQVLAVDPQRDLAILKVSGVKQLPKPIDYLAQPELAETMPICTFGFPFGEVLATGKRSPAITVGKGSISSLRLDESGALALVQIDGALNPGNSGGPVVDTQGRLIGVAVATIRNSTGIGLAIPAREVARMLQGRIGKVCFQSGKGDDGEASIHVEAALIDPFHKIKSVALHYVGHLDPSRASEKPRPGEPISALPGCHTLPLKIENDLVVGQMPIKKGVAQLTILHQAAYVNESGKQSLGDSVLETVKLTTEEVAKAADVAPPSTAQRPPEGKTPASPPSTWRNARPTPRANQARAAENDPSGPVADLGALVGDLNSDDMGRRIRAMLKLDRVKPQVSHPEVAKALETVLLEDGSPALRTHAARLLETWGTAENIPALRKAMNDPNRTVQAFAKKAIEVLSR